MSAIVVVVLVVVGLVLDGVARSFTEDLIRSEVRAALKLPASAPVDVGVGGTSAVLQLASGSLELVNVSVPQVTVGALSGAATLTARGIPIDQSKAIDSATVNFTVGQAGVQKLLSSFSGVPITSVELVSSGVKLGGNVSIFGMRIPVTVLATASAIDGQLAITPQSFEVNGATFSPAALTKAFGSIGENLQKTQKLCIASSLPKAFHLDQVSVSRKTATLVVSAKSVVLNDQLFSTRGVCP